MVVAEMATSHTLQEIDKVGVNTQHHRLGLGIAHTAVVLDDVGGHHLHSSAQRR